MSLVGDPFGRSNSNSWTRITATPTTTPAPSAGPLVTMKSNDQGMHVTQLNDAFLLSGRGVNRGIAGSELTVVVDGHRVDVPIGALEGPKKIAQDLADVLPAGYALETKSIANGDLLLKIVKDASAQPKPQNTTPSAPSSSSHGGWGAPSSGVWGSGSCLGGPGRRW